MNIYVHFNTIEKNKFEENRAAALVALEDVNNSDSKTEDSTNEKVVMENDNCVEKVDDTD